MKKFLVVGNGFDLAHNLPTKYSDFLYFLVMCIDFSSDLRHWNFYDEKNNSKIEQSAFDSILKNSSTNESVKKIFEENIEKIKQTLQSDSMKNFISNDLLKYMICVYASKQNLDYDFQWIDVEDELMKFVKDLNDLKNVSVGSTIYFPIPYQDGIERNFRTFYCKDITRYLKTLSNIPADKLKSEIFRYIFKNLE